ncbi:MAG: hypothetical protein HQ566_04205 [Candidatus Omnitrophica bacterium]|nr:hypothetical protein [Candidatus Omnitrophota bacterium]
MLTKKITRKEFLKTGFLGIVAVLAAPILKILGPRPNVSHKDARYYKNLAG